MKVVPDAEAAAWVEGLLGESEEFDWDRGNRTKNAKHRVAPEDVEAMFDSKALLVGRIVQPAHGEARWLLLGRDKRQRNLALIMTRRGNRVRPISCRAMRVKERGMYEEALRDQAEGSGRARPAGRGV